MIETLGTLIKTTQNFGLSFHKPTNQPTDQLLFKKSNNIIALCLLILALEAVWKIG